MYILPCPQGVLFIYKISLECLLNCKQRSFLTGENECTFVPGEDSITRGDHRGQMMAFCGHEDWCSEFNSKRVLQRAKLNIEKHYPVVGGEIYNIIEI